MKKNYSLRIAGFLLVLVLLSTCLISGTFAKYTTSGKGTDNARVAKWGVTITVTGDKAFAKNYKTDDSKATTISNSVNATNDKVLAPGTKGTLFTVKTSGNPEVAVEAKAEFSLTLKGWNINSGEEYCPLVFTVVKGNNENSKKFKIGNEDGEYNSIEALVKALKDYIEAGNKNYDPNEVLLENEDLNLTVTWEWAFDGDDTKDTALGDLNTAPTIQFSYGLTLTQID